MHTMEEERDMFAGLGWEKEIRSLGDPHVLFIPYPEHDKRAGNQCSDVAHLSMRSVRNTIGTRGPQSNTGDL